MRATSAGPRVKTLSRTQGGLPLASSSYPLWVVVISPKGGKAHLTQPGREGSIVSTLRRRRSPLLDGFCIGVILVACVLFFAMQIFTNRCFFPWDMADYYYPHQRFVSDAIHRGALPLWDPYVFSGFPISGDVQASLLYPPTVLSFFVPGAFPLRFKVVELVWILHVFLAGMATYLLGRKLALDRVGSLVAAMVFW